MVASYRGPLILFKAGTLLGVERLGDHQKAISSKVRKRTAPMAAPEDLKEIYTDELKDLWSANDQMKSC